MVQQVLLLIPTAFAIVASLIYISRRLTADRNTKSTNAEGVLFIRLLMTHLPPPLALDKKERIFAMSILSTHFVWCYYAIRIALLIITPTFLNSTILWLDNLKQGVFSFIASRVILYDEFFRRSIVEYKAKQIIILGAGFDCRAYRYADERRTADGVIPVYEVDLPWVQQHKRDLVRKVVENREHSFLRRFPCRSIQLPDNSLEGVHYVPCDFENEELSQCLLKAGFNPSLRTSISLEGVVLYLEPEAVAATLQSISGLFKHVTTKSIESIKGIEPATPPTASTTPSSQRDFSYPSPDTVTDDVEVYNMIRTPDEPFDVVTPPKANDEPLMNFFFDYFNEEQLGPSAHSRSQQIVRGMAQNNTPFKSGIPATSIEQYIAETGGFRLLRSWTPSDLQANFLPVWNNVLVESDWAYLVECCL